MKRSAVHRTVIHRHSGWLILLGFALAVLVPCGLFLLWYLRPGQQGGAPSSDAAPVALSMYGLKLSVPANHIETAAARAGGAQTVLALFALLPDMRGYSQEDAPLFSGNAPDSPVIHLLLRGDPNGMDAKARLARLYMPYLADAGGGPGPFGLTRYGFKPDSGYGRDELFAGDTASGPVLLLCERAQPDLPSPNCLATANPPARSVSLSWRFKRAWLADWRRIAMGVNGLMARFAAN